MNSLRFHIPYTPFLYFGFCSFFPVGLSVYIKRTSIYRIVWM